MPQDLIVTMLRKIGAKITIEVSPSSFIFYKGEKTLSFETSIYLANRDGKYIVAAVGEAPTGPETAIRVDLFDPKPPPVQTIQRSQCLEAFIKYAIAKLYNHKSFMRPRVYFRNAESLSSLLIGYQSTVLRSAAESAGAGTVEFVGYERDKPL